MHKHTALARASRKPFTCLIFVIFVLFGEVGAFFPWRWREIDGGRGGTSHEGITRDAFKETAEVFFGITKLTTSMEFARDTIVLYNAIVDGAEGQKTGANHFDGESFIGGQNRLVGLVNDIVKQLQDGDANGARQSLGSALHTLQDFYSHSTWIEMHADPIGPIVPLDAIYTDGATINFAPANIDTCVTCPTRSRLDDLFGQCPDCSHNYDPAVLTSGYFPGDDRPIPPGISKCHHGGAVEELANGKTDTIERLFIGDGKTVMGINKDSNMCHNSPHYWLHGRAVQFARQATFDFLLHVSARVTPNELRLLYGIGPPMGFAVDTTGSMGGVIADVRAQLIKIIDERISTLLGDTVDQPSSFVLAEINDPTTPPAFRTTDPDAFKTMLKALTAFGGDDCPELSMAGALNAIDALEVGANLFVVTDASAKDRSRANEVISRAQAKKITVYVFGFNSPCGFDSTYLDIAKATKGQYFTLSQTHAADITTLVDKVARANRVSLLEITKMKIVKYKPFGETPLRRRAELSRRADFSYTIAVDPSITAITFSFSADTTKLDVVRPDGSVVSAGDAGVSIIDVAKGSLVSIDAPTTGLWHAQITGRGNATLSVTGLSSLHFSGFDIVEHTGRPAHQGFFPINGSATPGSFAHAVANIDGNYTSAKFELRDAGGDLIKFMDMTAGTGEEGAPPTNSYLGNGTLPNEDTYIYITGIDENGKPFQRVFQRPLFSQTTFPPLNGTNSTTASNATTTLPPFPLSNSTSTSKANSVPTAAGTVSITKEKPSSSTSSKNYTSTTAYSAHPSGPNAERSISTPAHTVPIPPYGPTICYSMKLNGTASPAITYGKCSGCPAAPTKAARTTITTTLVTSFVYICPTGIATSTITKTTTYCLEDYPSGTPQSLFNADFTTTVTECKVCGLKPTMVTLTVPLSEVMTEAHITSTEVSSSATNVKPVVPSTSSLGSSGTVNGTAAQCVQESASLPRG